MAGYVDQQNGVCVHIALSLFFLALKKTQKPSFIWVCSSVLRSDGPQQMEES